MGAQTVQVKHRLGRSPGATVLELHIWIIGWGCVRQCILAEDANLPKLVKIKVYLFHVQKLASCAGGCKLPEGRGGDSC